MYFMLIYSCFVLHHKNRLKWSQFLYFMRHMRTSFMDGSYSNYVPSVTIIEVMNHRINESLAKKCFRMFLCVAMSSFAQNILFIHSLSLYDVDAIKIVSKVLYLCMCPVRYKKLTIQYWLFWLSLTINIIHITYK